MEITKKSHVVDIDNGHRRSSFIDGNGSDEHPHAADSEDKDQRSSHDASGAEVVRVSERERVSPASECSVEVGLGNAITEVKVHSSEVKMDCSICHLSMDMTNRKSGSIELECSSKDDLVAAHKLRLVQDQGKQVPRETTLYVVH